MSSTTPRDSVLRGKLPAEVRGVQVQIAPAADGTFALHGVYRLPADDVVDLPPPLLRALTLAVQVGLQPILVRPFAETVLFEDDHVSTSVGEEGAFTIDSEDLWKALNGRRAGLYHLFVLIGPHASNVVEVEVAG